MGVQAAFYVAHKGDYLDAIIARLSQGPYSHAELVFESDGLCFSSSFRDDGVRYKQIDLTDGKWFLIDLPEVTPEIEARIRTWCDREVGKPYDWKGVFGFVVPFLGENKKKWFCSEICLAALQSVGLYLVAEPHDVSPNRLAQILRGDDL